MKKKNPIVGAPKLDTKEQARAHSFNANKHTSNRPPIYKPKTCGLVWRKPNHHIFAHIFCVETVCPFFFAYKTPVSNFCAPPIGFFSSLKSPSLLEFCFTYRPINYYPDGQFFSEITNNPPHPIQTLHCF